MALNGTNATILVVDCDSQMRRVVVTALQSQGYRAEEAFSGEEALEFIRLVKFDLVLLEIDLPGESGIALCRQIHSKFAIPIIVLTFRDELGDKIEALDSGASDCIPKPFGVREMFARVRAVLRRHRSGGRSARQIRFGEIELDFEARRLTVSGQHVRLTLKEFDLLQYLIIHANETLPHRRILDRVWGPEVGDELYSLRVMINRLRNKIEAIPHRPKYLKTEVAVGYRIEIPD